MDSSLAIDFNVLRTTFERAWCRETSADPMAWNPDRPSSGQCAVTALVVQDLLGGDLVRARVGDTTHYWNRLSDGFDIDLTRDQFPENVELREEELRTREYVLSFPDTRKRYVKLKERVKDREGLLGRER